MENPQLLLFQKQAGAYRLVFGTPASGVPSDAVLNVGMTLQGTYCLAVGQSPISGYGPGGVPLILGVSSEPLVFVGATSSTPAPTTGQPYQVLFNFETHVTGVNLTVGKRFSRESQVGLTTRNRSGRGQTIAVSGRKRALYKFLLILHEVDGPILIDVSTPRSLALQRARSHSDSENITAALKTGRYRVTPGDGNVRGYTVAVVESGSGSQRRAGRVRGKVLTKARHVRQPQFADTVGTIVNLRARGGSIPLPSGSPRGVSR